MRSLFHCFVGFVYLQAVYFKCFDTIFSFGGTFVIPGHTALMKWLHSVLSTDSDENSHQQLDSANSSTLMPPSTYVIILIFVLYFISLKYIYAIKSS